MKDQESLTCYPEGSVRELWSVSFPLMISSLAMLLMLFTDRIFLSHYSIGAFNASVNAGTLAWAFMAGFGMIAAMSEIFVAQYNGAKIFLKLGSPVWQMIWFSLFSFLFFIPMAIWGAPAIFSGDLYAELEIEYFRWVMFFAPTYALMTACSGFFIGRGKTKLMIALAIAANGFNILLDRLLIFGVDGYIPEMGIQGAAIATCFGYCFQSAVLFYLFLRKENREQFGTGNWRFCSSQMAQCLKIGVPQGIFCALEIFGWAVFYWMMTALSEKHITISSICQSFNILLSFFFDGLYRGSAAVAANFIGARQYLLVNRVLKSGLALLLVFLSIVSLIFIFDPVEITRMIFFAQREGNPILDPTFASSLKICMLLSFAYLFFDGLRWVLSALLTAAGDTLFLLILGSLSVWAFLLLPIYTIVVQNRLDVEYAWGLTVLYAILFFIVYWIRFKRGAWQSVDLIGKSNLQATEESADTHP